MNRFAVALVAVPVLVVGSACIPSRDNVNDPLNKPTIEFTVSPIDGSPHTPFTFTILSSTPVTNSLDLDGDGIYETLVTASNGTVYKGEVPVGAGGYGPGGIGSLTQTVSLRSSGPSGETIKQVDLRLHNAAPQLDLGPEVIAAAWEAPLLHLDACGEVLGCPSPDPDPDDGPLDQYRWTQLYGTPVLAGLNTTTSSISFAAPFAPQTLVFELQVSDGYATAKAAVGVRIGHPGWLASESPSRLYRVFPGSLHVEDLALPPVIAAYSATNGDVWVITGNYNVANWEVDRYSPSGAFLGRWPLPGSNNFGGGGPIVGHGDNGGWIAVGVYGTQYHAELRHLLPIVTGTNGTAVSYDPGFSPKQLLEDPTVSGGALILGVTSGFHLAPNGAVGASFPFQSGSYAATATDGTVWTAEPSGGNHIIITHLLPGDVQEGVTLTTYETLTGLAPGVEGVLLVLSSGSVLTSVQPMLDVSGSLPPTIPADPVNLFNGPRVCSDGDGDLWIVDSFEATARRLHGTTEGFRLAVDATFEELGLPSAGALQPGVGVPDASNEGVLITGGESAGHMLYVRVPASGRPLEQVVAPLPPEPHTDPSRGAYWSPHQVSSTMFVRRFDAREVTLGGWQVPSGESAFPGSMTSLWNGGLALATQKQNQTDSVFHILSRNGTEQGTPLDLAVGRVFSMGVDTASNIVCFASSTGTGNIGDPQIAHHYMFNGGAPVEFANAPIAFGGGVSPTRSGGCWAWSNRSLFYADAQGAHAVTQTVNADGVAADPYDDTAWVYDNSTHVISHVALGGTLGTIPLLDFVPPSANGDQHFAITRECDPTLATTEGDLACRNLWLGNSQDPGTIFRYDGTGALISTFPLTAGLGAWIDMR